MKTTRKTLFLLAICLLSLPNRNSAEEPKGHDLIEKVCGKVDAKYADLCTKVLKGDPRSKDATLNDLAYMCLNAASQYAASITSDLKKSSVNDELDPAVEQGMADCFDNYLDAEDQVEDAIAALSVNNTSDAAKWLDAALAATETCDKALQGHDKFIAATNEEFRKLCLITLSICHDMEPEGDHHA